MELLILSALAVVSVLLAIGTTAAVTGILMLWYGRWYWNGLERRYTRDTLWQWSRGGRGWKWVRALLRHDMEPFTPPAGPVVYACRPHAMLVVSSWLTFLSGARDTHATKVLVAVHSYLFYVPGFREVLLGLGCIDVSRDSIEHALSLGFSVAIMPGGVKEMGPPLLPLNDPPGIVNLAKEYEVPLVAVHFGGEKDLFWTWEKEWPVVKSFRTLTYTWFGIFFPLFFFPRVWVWRTLALHTRFKLLVPSDMLKDYKAFFDETIII